MTKKHLFLKKLKKLISDENSNDAISKYNKIKNSFIVKSKSKLEKHLKKHFKHSSYSSFVRQLNNYKFSRKIESNRDIWINPKLDVKKELNKTVHLKNSRLYRFDKETLIQKFVRGSMLDNEEWMKQIKIDLNELETKISFIMDRLENNRFIESKMNMYGFDDWYKEYDDRDDENRVSSYDSEYSFLNTDD